MLIHLNGHWVPCGLLEYTERGRLSSSAFRYGQRYLERRDAISVDPAQLPLRETTFNTEEGFSIFNGIRDAGPDRWGRYLLDKKFARSLNELEYVAASADDRVGALAFTSDLKKGPQQFQADGSFNVIKEPKRLNLNQCMGAIDDIFSKEETERLKKYLDYGPSLGGARPKASVLWNDELYLAKFAVSLDTRNEPLIEYATMTLAQRCGLNVPELDLQKVDGRNIFLIKRFDRVLGERKPFISGLTITGTHESDFQSWSYFALAEAVLKYSSRPEKDLKELYRRLIFNIAVYNNDDHLRNFGFLGHEGNWDLSPLYDVVPAAVHTNTYALAMTFGMEGKKASYQNALSMCLQFRLSEEEAQVIIKDIKNVVSSWRDHFANVGVSKADIAALENSFADKA
ncbi:MAG: type II toxin-antitoxin system HipA family toxin [Pseudobdellovibrionaceae bacterium]